MVGFARPELPNVTYIATTNELNIDETVDVIPRNWILKQKWNLHSQVLWQPQGTSSEYSDYSWESRKPQEVTEIQTSYTVRKLVQLESAVSSQCEYSEDLTDSPPGGAVQRNITKVVQGENLMIQTSQLQTHESSKTLKNSLP